MINLSNERIRIGTYVFHASSKTIGMVTEIITSKAPGPAVIEIVVPGAEPIFVLDTQIVPVDERIGSIAFEFEKFSTNLAASSAVLAPEASTIKKKLDTIHTMLSDIITTTIH